MSLVFTDVGITAINASRSNGFMLDLVAFKVTDGTVEPETTDTRTTFENDGSVLFTGTLSQGHISNKRVIDEHTFNLDLTVPPEVPTGGGSFDISKVGLYVTNPDPSPPAGEELVLIATTLFENPFKKFAPSPTNAGNSLVLTLVIGFDNATSTIQVLPYSDRDFNHYAEYTTVDDLPPAKNSPDRVVRVTRPSNLYAGAGNNTYLVHSTKNGGVSDPEWIPDNHSLLFPLHALPAIHPGLTAGGTSYVHSQTKIHVVYNSNTLDDPDTHVMNRIPVARDGLLLSFFVDNPSATSNNLGLGGIIRQVTDVEQVIDLDGGSTTTGRELIVFTLAEGTPQTAAVNELFKVWVSNTALQPGSGGGSGGGLLDATHEAIAEKVMQRDSTGSAKVNVATTSTDADANLDIVNRGLLETQVSSVQDALTAHDTTDTNAHAHLMSVTASSNKVVQRDSSGRAEISSPQTDNQISNKLYVDTQITNLSDNISSQIQQLMEDAIDAYITANIDSYVDPKLNTHNTDSNAHADLFEEAAIAATAPVRDGNGRIKSQDPNAPEDVLTLNYFNNNSTLTGEPNKVIKLNGVGMGQVAGNALNPNDIVNKSYLEAQLASDTSIFGGLVSIVTSSETLVKRDANGRVFAADPTDAGHVVNLGYLETTYPVINPSTNAKQGDMLFLNDTNVTGGKRVYIYTGPSSTVQVYPAQYS